MDPAVASSRIQVTQRLEEGEMGDGRKELYSFAVSSRYIPNHAAHIQCTSMGKSPLALLYKL
jgi:hypothetical protein